MGNTQRIPITMSADMMEGLKQIADTQGVSIAELVRQQMRLYLASQGVSIDDNVEWGGERKGRKDA